jgi:CHASE3 domain sensor protein
MTSRPIPPIKRRGSVGKLLRILNARKKSLRGLAPFLLLLMTLSGFSSFSSQKQDYLTDDEVEQLREAQEPAERMKLLDGFLKERLQKAKALRSPASAAHGENKTDAGKDKNSTPKGAKIPSATGSTAPPQKSTQKSFADLMGEYLQCLEEISSNLENFSSFRVEPKTYLKSLKGLDQSLQEHRKWIGEISGKLNRSEKDIVTEVSEALQELSVDIDTEIQKANDEVKADKESKKAKNDRH